MTEIVANNTARQAVERRMLIFVSEGFLKRNDRKIGLCVWVLEEEREGISVMMLD